MQSRFTKFVCIAALVIPALAIPAVAQAQMTQTANGYLFRLQSAAGKKLDFVMMLSQHIEMPNIPGMPANMRNMPNMSLSLPVQEVITAVHGDVLTVSMNGKVIGKARTMMMKMKNDGETFGGSVLGMPDMSFGDIFAHLIQIGHTYSVPFSTKSAPGSSFPMTGVNKIKFVGFTVYHGIRSARFDVIITSSSSLQPGHPGVETTIVHGSGALLISVADGWPERIKMITTSRTIGNQVGLGAGMPTMTMTMTMTRK